MSALPTDIDLELCFARADARPVDQGAVAALVISINEIGLLQPVSVRRLQELPDEDAFEVVAGLHRVEAFRRLGRSTIPAVVLQADDLRAELILIDENLCRNELSPAERSAAIAKRKTIYETLHPETAHGATGNGRAKSRVVNSTTLPEESIRRFTKATAEVTGRSEASVQKEARRGAELGEAALTKLARTSLDKGDELDALVKLTPERRDELIQKAVAGQDVSARHEVKKERRDNRERVLAAVQIALPEKRYGVIYADPEWQFQVYSRESGMDRAADNHYPTSPTDDICARPVASIAADDCVLFLWATVPMLPDALRVMSAWGFEYKSHRIWAKDRIGTGYWFRNQHELLLVGTKGDVPAPAMGTQSESILTAPVDRHSAKPVAFYEMIERYFPNLPKIELNARTARAGWDRWGNEAPDSPETASEKVGGDPVAAAPLSCGGNRRQDEVEINVSGGAAELPVASPLASAIAQGPEPYRNADDGLDIPAFLRRRRPASQEAL